MRPDQRTGDSPHPFTSRRMPIRDLAHVTVREEQGIAIAVIAGELDLSNAAHIGLQLIDLPNRAPGLIVDLREVSYLDSTGLALLWDVSLRLRQRAQDLIVVSPPGSAPRLVLEMTGLHTRITMVDELGEALARLGGAPPAD